MIKYESTLITFTEVPDEISYCFNLSRCPCRCENCFEPWLRDDIGTPLTATVLREVIEQHPYISCICFMGGDNDHTSIVEFAKVIKGIKPSLNVAMYSGFQNIDNNLVDVLDYYKVGPYKPQCGPLNNPNTNQRMYKIINGHLIDITYRFQQPKQ